MKKHKVLILIITITLFSFSCEKIRIKKLSNEDFVGAYKIIEVSLIDNSSVVTSINSLCLNQTVLITLDPDNSKNLEVMLSEVCEPFYYFGWSGRVNNNMLHANRYLSWNDWGSNLTACTIIYSLEGEWNENKTAIDVTYSWADCTILGNSDPIITHTESMGATIKLKRL